MVLKKIKLLTVSFLLLSMSFVFAQSEKKLALVIGNASYTQSNALRNPVRDASAMRDKLKSLGFEVIYAENASEDKFEKVLDDFYERLQGCNLGLFYFSGHGIESGGRNYLLPISSTIKTEKDLGHAVDLSEVMSDASYAGAKQLIFIIDACRNNPLKTTRGAPRGISVVNNNDISRSIVVCACGSGKTADDGNRGEHSPFTQALLNHIADSGKTFDAVIRDVRREVSEATNNQQVPELCFDNTIEAIYLNGGTKPGPDKKKDHYRDDNSVNSGVVFLCLALFAVLLFAMLACFVVFTSKGREVCVAAKTRVSEGVNKSVNFVKSKSESAKNSIDLIVAENKKNAEAKKEAQAQNEAEKQKSIEEEKARLEKFILPSVKLNNMLYVAKTPVTVSQFTGKSNAGVNGASSGDFPVTNVSWLEAASFLNELSKKEKLEPVYDLSDSQNVKIDLSKNGWRFPTELEWKKLAAGSTGDLESCAWYNDNSFDECHECGKKSATKDGLYDVYGLVWEWCSDSLKGKYVLKGGAWDCSKKYCKSSASLYAVKEFKSDSVGFRGVRNI
ncbi:caspase family protein [Treponema sp.]|uniref:caspase family protein n=1 Tax=Treponema sp. TaxID=166 RepID=UPI00298E8893|nr:caspase family protein [Treponema sp.]MCR5613729.1 caspase family protein [Treponema sp.]